MHWLNIVLPKCPKKTTSTKNYKPTNQPNYHKSVAHFAGSLNLKIAFQFHKIILLQLYHTNILLSLVKKNKDFDTLMSHKLWPCDNRVATSKIVLIKTTTKSFLYQFPGLNFYINEIPSE